MEKEIVVQKYGGSSLTNLAMMTKIAEYVAKITKESNEVQGKIIPVIVVSAMGKETELLINLAYQATGSQPPKRELSKLLATGENRSAALLAMMLKKRFDVEAVSLNASDIPLIIDGKGNFKITELPMVRYLLNQGIIPVITGFQGIEEATGELIVLERGGSDLTAIAVAASLGLSGCEIYTDVDGVFTADPRIVPDAIKFQKISYDQMIILTTAGCGVMMDKSVILAQSLGVEIKVMLSPSFEETTGGTLIVSEKEMGLDIKPGLAVKVGVLIRIESKPELSQIIFSRLADINIIDGVQILSEENKYIFNVFCSSDNSPLIIAQLQKIYSEEGNNNILWSEISAAGLTLVDLSMRSNPGYLAKMSQAINSAGVNVEMISSSGATILALVSENSLTKAAQAVAESFSLINH